MSMDAMDSPPVIEPQEPTQQPALRRISFHGWTIIFICAGLGLLAACYLIPQADRNQQIHYQNLQLQADLDYLQRRADANAEFIKRVGSDPVLAERLAQRQLNFIRKGASPLKLEGDPAEDQAGMSPFALVAVEPAPEIPAPQPVGGRFADWCRQPRKRLFTVGAALMLMAVGLVLGYTGTRRLAPAA